MRSLLVKSSVTILIMLALGSGLTLAATSSKPGMFLYPIKQRTQKFTGAEGNPVTPPMPVITIPQEGVPQEGVPQEGVPQEGVPQEGVPQEGKGQQPSANVDIPSGDIQEDVAEEPGITQAGQANETIATPAPTPVRVVDEITVTIEPGAVPSGGSDTIDDASGPPAIEQLGSGYVDDSRNDDGQPEGSNVGDLGDGQAGKEDGNDNDSGHSNNNDDDESDDDKDNDD